MKVDNCEQIQLIPFSFQLLSNLTPKAGDWSGQDLVAAVTSCWSFLGESSMDWLLDVQIAGESRNSEEKCFGLSSFKTNN